ncbi:RNA-directed DNA polymerase [Qipengyuania sp. 1XM1-15A]|uniref:RNA-directed DNA polymerase n=1 Tax=Qipengyuania xiamenensis TaxID=2867237 RepID=UPI001C87845B|nr:RNA-directed DNA polymerase [Qipengyuania xiamenensis]MBX7532639.1 RNA-directed DNA polymerase [Qipengyuania xiamenensis]
MHIGQKMRNYRELITSPENLSWAWRKARRLYIDSDGFIDYGEISAFELDIDSQLKAISADLSSGEYRLANLVHLPQPKKPDDDGPRMRQYFHVKVRDQVAWLAVANVIGPTLDSKMPNWSYGNRLYKAAWWEDDDGSEKLEIGPYRDSTGRLYRKFQHSWPLFRRQLSLTARLMVDGLGDPELLEDSEKQAFSYSERPRYLDPDYWPEAQSKAIYYASLDLERFYPSIRTDAILKVFSSHLDGFDEDPWLKNLLSNMLDFSIAKNGSCRLEDPLVQPVTEAGSFPHLPTGLMVAGFLANVLMLPIDDEIERKLLTNRNVAHFRFVDDHAIIATGFDELIDWIKAYDNLLKQYDVGAKISETKYDPPRIFDVVTGTANKEVESQVRSEAELDGSQPAALLTKTLALVSELANADFDILPEQSRMQRLGELEWLLLAGIPEDEIRADTRAAFAAGRIAQLVPIAFNPSPELVQAWRAYRRLRSIEEDQRSPDHSEELEGARRSLRERSNADYKRYRKLTAHYFKLLERAFTEHPNRARLLLRIFRYCRVTGHGGVATTLSWIVKQSESDHFPTAQYLSSFSLQALAVNVAAAAHALTNEHLLYRERLAARWFLLSVSSSKSITSINAILLQDRERHCCDESAISALRAAIALAKAVTSREPRFSAINRRVSALAEAIDAPSLASNSSTWTEKTGRSIGVWVHFLEMFGRSDEASFAWRVSAQAHDPLHLLDWMNLRKHPEELPPQASEFLSETPPRKLNTRDAGWLLDHRRSPDFVRSLVLEDSEAGQAIKRYEDELSKLEGYLSLIEWTAALEDLSRSDPRVSEWTALEIMRLLLDKTTSFGDGSIADLDELHPSNILLPSAWLQLPPQEEAGLVGQWTWTAWHSFARRAQIEIVTNKIEDYRRQPLFGTDLSPVERWTYQLRGCGLLLLGLITRDFSLPAYWNVPGLERDITSFVRHCLEESIISSRSQSIIEAATLPRSVETRMIQNAPWAFFGNRASDIINDTRSDPPLLRDIAALKDAIVEAQQVLERNQLTVLNHAPRQLVPMNIIQLSKNAVEIPEIEA